MTVWASLKKIVVKPVKVVVTSLYKYGSIKKRPDRGAYAL